MFDIALMYMVAKIKSLRLVKITILRIDIISISKALYKEDF